MTTRLVRPPAAVVSLPRFSGVLAPLNGAMEQIERAFVGVLRGTGDVSVPAIILQAPDGGSWRVTVAADGQLQTDSVDRTT